MNPIEIAEEMIKLSKKFLDDSNSEMANYVLRDLNITKEAGLDNLSWSMYWGNISKNDVLYLIEKIEEFIKRKINE